MSYFAIANNAVRAGLGALATIALFASAPAAADEPSQVRVAYGDLDLTSDAGQDTLNQRIRSAVKRVCGSMGRSASEAIDYAGCKKAAFANARGQMQIAVAKAGERKARATSLAFAAPRPGTR